MNDTSTRMLTVPCKALRALLALVLALGLIPAAPILELTQAYGVDISLEVASTATAVVDEGVEHGTVEIQVSNGYLYVTKNDPDDGYCLYDLWAEMPDGTRESLCIYKSVKMPQSGEVRVCADFGETTDEPYLVIGSLDEFLSFADAVNAGNVYLNRKVSLGCDVDLSGSSFSTMSKFAGTFDGQGHEVSGLSVPLFREVYAATFEDLVTDGSIECDDDLTLSLASIACAATSGTTFSGCTNHADVTAVDKGYYVGGLVGMTYPPGSAWPSTHVVFERCANYGNVGYSNGGKQTTSGGLLAWSATGLAVSGCGNYGKVAGTYHAGGIAGYVREDCGDVSFSSCLNRGDVSTVSYNNYDCCSGGMVGCMEHVGDNAITFADCYNTGAIYAESQATTQRYTMCAAGVAGMEISPKTCTAPVSLTDCYNTGTVTRSGPLASAEYQVGELLPDVIGISGSYNKVVSTAAMADYAEVSNCYRSADSFTAADLGSAWRDDVPGGSPLLSWEPEDATNSKGGVPATGIALSEGTLALEEGDAATLGAAVEPEGATDVVSWSSSDESVATVSGKGGVTAVGAGECDVTATAGSVSATCHVTVSAFCGTLVAADAGDLTVTGGGSYKLSHGYSGKVTVATARAVDVKGAGTGRSDALSDVTFDCSGQATDLTLRDLYVSDSANVNLIDFAGEGNRLSIEGTCILDYQENQYAGGHDAVIHVGKGTSLTVAGSGTLYLYKSGAGAGIGGDYMELNGDVTFAMSDATGNLFAKGTKQSALIGAGANAASDTEAPGAISFTGGTYSLISNSRGAAIGGSAGSGGASAGTEVSISGNASVNVNCDWTGTAVGGGGYAEGSDASGGTLTVTGGSFRTYVDKNAAANVGGTYWKGLPLTEGISNVEVTAQRKNASGEDVYLCAIDTTGIEPDSDGNFTVTVDGEAYYTGKTHAWAFLQEATDRELPGGGRAETGVTYTPDNWVAGDDPCLYAYLTAEDHEIQVNGISLKATWDASALGTSGECTGGCFALSEPEPEPEPDPIYDYTPGDVNANGHVNVVDAQIVLDMANCVWDATEAEVAAGATAGRYGLLLDALRAAGTSWNLVTLEAAADANKDGAIDAADARAIQIYTVTDAWN